MTSIVRELPAESKHKNRVHYLHATTTPERARLATITTPGEAKTLNFHIRIVVTQV